MQKKTSRAGRGMSFLPYCGRSSTVLPPRLSYTRWEMERTVRPRGRMAQRFQHAGLRLGVQIGGDLIQQHHRRIDRVVEAGALHGGVAVADAPVIAALHIHLQPQRPDGADVVQRLRHLTGHGGHGAASSPTL